VLGKRDGKSEESLEERKMYYGMGCQFSYLLGALIISQPSYRPLRVVLSILGNMNNLRLVVFL
jgi:hypothetical protein